MLARLMCVVFVPEDCWRHQPSASGGSPSGPVDGCGCGGRRPERERKGRPKLALGSPSSLCLRWSSLRGWAPRSSGKKQNCEAELAETFKKNLDAEKQQTSGRTAPAPCPHGRRWCVDDCGACGLSISPPSQGGRTHSRSVSKKNEWRISKNVCGWHQTGVRGERHPPPPATTLACGSLWALCSMHVICLSVGCGERMLQKPSGKFQATSGRPRTLVAEPLSPDRDASRGSPRGGTLPVQGPRLLCSVSRICGISEHLCAGYTHKRLAHPREGRDTKQ